MAKLTILAGPAALQQIRDRGLQAEDVTSVFGASGAAKWLTIYALDKAVFSEFLAGSEQVIGLFGTSIGAFKLAAAAQEDPAGALGRLANAYIEQHYEGDVTAAAIARESARITGEMLGDRGVTEILSNPRFRFHCGTVRCRGMLASETLWRQRFGMARAFALAALSRPRMQSVATRAVFSDARDPDGFPGADGYATERYELDKDNFQRAILASGSIPIVMQGVRGLPGDGVYRDGGLLDYHPVPSNLTTRRSGLVLYPHFYPYLIEGWFDKFLGKRRVEGSRLDNVVLVAPSAEYVASLPGGQIPDRKDFHTFAHDDAERQRRWREATERSAALAEEFLALIRSGDIAARVQPFEDG